MNIVDKESYAELRSLIGKKIIDVKAVTNDDNCFSFELKFDDNTILELYDMRCDLYDVCDKIGKVEVVTSLTGEPIMKEISKDELGGGLAFCIRKEVD